MAKRKAEGADDAPPEKKTKRAPRKKNPGTRARFMRSKAPGAVEPVPRRAEFWADRMSYKSFRALRRIAESGVCIRSFTPSDLGYRNALAALFLWNSEARAYVCARANFFDLFGRGEYSRSPTQEEIAHRLAAAVGADMETWGSDLWTPEAQMEVSDSSANHDSSAKVKTMETGLIPLSYFLTNPGTRGTLLQLGHRPCVSVRPADVKAFYGEFFPGARNHDENKRAVVVLVFQRATPHELWLWGKVQLERVGAYRSGPRDRPHKLGVSNAVIDEFADVMLIGWFVASALADRDIVAARDERPALSVPAIGDILCRLGALGSAPGIADVAAIVEKLGGVAEVDAASSTSESGPDLSADEIAALQAAESMASDPPAPPVSPTYIAPGQEELPDAAASDADDPPSGAEHGGEVPVEVAE